ncbi:MAG: hydrogenase nickel incorporation protein HypB [Chloroflexota bacterium]
MSKTSRIRVEKDLIRAARELGTKNRDLLDRAGVRACNIMGAIGSGKTSLIEKTIERLKADYRIAVIAGDIIADFDSARFRKYDVPVVPLNTGKECHLDANLVRQALEQLKLDGIDLLFIENVGNLICPSDFYLGEHKRVIVVSVTEGDAIVAKHPAIFKSADVAIINKVDVAPFIGADPERMLSDARRNVPLAFQTSLRTGLGLEQWLNWVRNDLATAT